MRDSDEVRAARLALYVHYKTLMVAEYERIGVAAEMEKYFNASGDTPLTKENLEAILARLRAIPSGITFDEFCAYMGIDVQALREIDELFRSRFPTSE
jgi:hypothetical protein